MSSRALLWIMALTACTSTGTIPAEVTRSLEDRQFGAPARIEIENGRIVAWGLPIALRDLPERVARAADSIQPGGDLVAVHSIWRGDERSFQIEKRYDGAEWRSLELAEDTAVIMRSHSIPLDDAPEPVRQAAGDSARFEFVQGRRPDRYRASYGTADAPDRVVEFFADGTVYREIRTHSAHLRAVR